LSLAKHEQIASEDADERSRQSFRIGETFDGDD